MTTLSRFILVLILFVSFASHAQQDKTLLATEWQDDLRFLQTKAHKEYPFLFKKITSEDFDAAVDKLYQEIPSLEAHEIPVAFSRIVALFEYGHTQLPFSTLANDQILPVNIYQFSDGVYIEGAHKNHLKIVGAKVLEIEGIPIMKVFEMIRPVVPAENDQYFKAYGLRFAMVPNILHAQGVISELKSDITFTLEKDGKTFKHTLKAVPRDQLSIDYSYVTPNDDWVSSRDQAWTPNYLKDLEKLYYYEYFPKQKAVYVRHSSIRNDVSEDIKTFYGKVFDFIDTNDVEKLILDVRLNGGGNNYLNKPIITGIIERPELNKEGKFFTIIGRRTFSACQNLVNELDNYTNTIFVGEPTAENVNFYGDTKREILPNSGLSVYLSFAWWQDKPQWENRDWTIPHIAVDMTFHDYRTNYDPVLEAALNFSSDEAFILDPMEHLTQLFLAGKLDDVKRDAAKIAHNPEYRYYDFEGEFSKAGTRLLGSGDTTAKQSGLFILDLVVELYPKSVKALYSLAYAQEVNDQNDKAIATYKKIIALDPDGSLATASKNRIEALKK